MLLAQKGYVTGAKGVCYWRKRGMLLAQKNFLNFFGYEIIGFSMAFDMTIEDTKKRAIFQYY
jgi:hypothetical protein